MARQQSEIERIRQANDIVEVVGEHLSLKRSGRSLKGLCPFHPDKKTPSLHVYPDPQIFKCFGCGAGGDVFKFIQLRENVEFREALRMLAARAGIELTSTPGESRPRGPDRTTLIRANEWAARWFQAQLRHPQIGAQARAYVEGRQINQETAARFGLGFAPGSYDQLVQQGTAAKFPLPVLAAAGLTRTSDQGRPYAVFRNRLMFPIRDSTKRIIGFGGRTLGDDPAKYLNTPETVLFNKGREVFGLDWARESVARSGRVVVTEGYTDCLMIHQFGITNVVAALGTSFTTEQAKLLHRFGDEVILVFDSDEAGQRAADRALEVALAEAMTVRLARVPEGKDPCDFLLSVGSQAFEALLNSASEALEFKWQQVLSQAPASVGVSRSHRAINGFLGLVARSAVRENVDPVHLGFIVSRTSKLLALPADQVYRYVAKLRDQERSTVRRAGAAQGAGPVKGLTGPRDVAVRALLEVLLNAPQHFEAVNVYLNPEQIADRQLARIVSEFCSACRSDRGYDLTDFLSGFEEPAMTALITDLRFAGQRRGNYEATLRGAIERLRQEQAPGQASGCGEPSDEPIESRLGRVSEAARNRRHFAGQGHSHLIPPWEAPDGPAWGSTTEGKG